jgi:hypothetical protein
MTVAQRKVVSDGSQMNVRTNRVGLLSIHATAPVIDGEVSDTALSFTVRIDQVVTGNPLLDPELHALIREITRGTLTYSGRRNGDAFEGQATAGSIVVPLTLNARGTGPLEISGSSQFADVHVPLPGLGHIKHLIVDIDGSLHVE